MTDCNLQETSLTVSMTALAGFLIPSTTGLAEGGPFSLLPFSVWWRPSALLLRSIGVSFVPVVSCSVSEWA